MSQIAGYLPLTSTLKLYPTPIWDSLVMSDLSNSYDFSTGKANFIPIANAITYLEDKKHVFLRYQDKILHIYQNPYQRITITKIIPFSVWIVKKGRLEETRSSLFDQKLKYNAKNKNIRIRYEDGIKSRDKIKISFRGIRKVNISVMLDYSIDTRFHEYYDKHHGKIMQSYFYPAIKDYLLWEILPMLKYYQSHPEFSRLLNPHENEMVKSWFAIYSDDILEQYFYWDPDAKKFNSLYIPTHPLEGDMSPHLIDNWPPEKIMHSRLKELLNVKYLQGVSKDHKLTWDDIIFLSHD